MSFHFYFENKKLNYNVLYPLNETSHNKWNYVDRKTLLEQYLQSNKKKQQQQIYSRYIKI